VHRYNAEGIAGLCNRPKPGRTPKLTEGQMASLKAIVLAGPDQAVEQIGRWRVAICAAMSKLPRRIPRPSGWRSAIPSRALAIAISRALTRPSFSRRACRRQFLRTDVIPDHNSFAESGSTQVGIRCETAYRTRVS